MHASERVDVYLPAAAKPVIEKCTGIYFSEYPASADGPKDVSYQIPWETRACYLTRTEWVNHNHTGVSGRRLLSYPANTVAKLGSPER